MEIYIILAVSFAIMYWFNYTREIIKTVKGVEETLSLDVETLSPGVYTAKTFVLTTLMAPWYLAKITSDSRWGYIKRVATDLIRKQHVIEIAAQD